MLYEIKSPTCTRKLLNTNITDTGKGNNRRWQAPGEQRVQRANFAGRFRHGSPRSCTSQVTRGDMGIPLTQTTIQKSHSLHRSGFFTCVHWLDFAPLLPVEQSLFLVGLTLVGQQSVPNALDLLIQHRNIQRFFTDDNGFSVLRRRCHLFHAAVLANQIVHMCLTHTAHHTVNFQCCLYHDRYRLSSFLRAAPERSAFVYYIPCRGICQ